MQVPQGYLLQLLFLESDGASEVSVGITAVVLNVQPLVLAKTKVGDLADLERVDEDVSAGQITVDPSLCLQIPGGA